jgi:hypothetical protein
MRFDRLDHVLRASGMKTAGRGQQRRDPSLIDTKSADNKCPHLLSVVLVSVAVRPATLVRSFVSAGSNPGCISQRANTFISAFWTSAKLAPAAARRGLRTMSQGATRLARCNRKASRSRRLMRLRTTAPPSARVAVTPSRGPEGSACFVESRARQNAANNGPDTRKP